MNEFYNVEVEEKMNRKIISTIGWALSALVVFSQIGGIIVAIICEKFIPDLAKSSIYNFIVSILPIYLIALPIFLLIIRKIPKYDINEKSNLTIVEFIKVLIISFGAMYIFNLLGVGVNFLISLLKGSEVANPLADLLSKVNLLESLIFVGILAPIMEELIFRKILLSRLRKFGDSFSIFFSALAFGMFHGNLSQFFYAVALGCILGYIVVKTGTIKYSIALHMCINIFGSVVIPGIVSMNNIIATEIIGFVYIFIIIGSIVLFINNKKNIVLDDNCISLTKKEKFKLMFANAGMIIYTILFFLLITIVIIEL